MDWLVVSPVIIGGALLFAYADRLMRFVDRKLDEWYPWLSEVMLMYDHKRRRPWLYLPLELGIPFAKFIGASAVLLGVISLIVLAGGDSR